jgi:hypothetical protein
LVKPRRASRIRLRAARKQRRVEPHLDPWGLLPVRQLRNTLHQVVLQASRADQPVMVDISRRIIERVQHALAKAPCCQVSLSSDISLSLDEVSTVTFAAARPVRGVSASIGIAAPFIASWHPSGRRPAEPAPARIWLVRAAHALGHRPSGGLPRRHDRPVVIGHLHAEGYQIYLGVFRQLRRIGKRVQTAAISNCGRARRAGMWAIDANPRLALGLTISTRIFPLAAINPSRERRSALIGTC